MVILVVYEHPIVDKKKFNEYFHRKFEKLSKSKLPSVTAGDFNVDVLKNLQIVPNYRCAQSRLSSNGFEHFSESLLLDPHLSSIISLSANYLSH